MIGLELLRRFWLPLAAVLVLAGSHFAVYYHGKSVERGEWSTRWADRDTADAAAHAAAEAAARAAEQAEQVHMNKVQTDAIQRLETAQTDAAGANAAADRLRVQVNKLLAAGRTAEAARTCTGSPAAENPGNLLAVVLDKSIARNRELAAFADSALIAAQACRAAWANQ